MTDLFVLAGEMSGDLHGARLVKSLLTLKPNLTASGVVGPRLRKIGVETFLPTEQFQMFGFVDVLKTLPRIRRELHQICDEIITTKPGVTLLIDYPGLNLRLAKMLKKRGYDGKIVQFISPKFWAWRHKRRDQMVKVLDQLLCIFPFEPKYFEKTTLQCDYIGNPLVEEVADAGDALYKHSVVGLFPGSRKSEIEMNLKRMLGAVKRLRQSNPDLVFAVSIANEAVRPLIEAQVDDSIRLVEPHDRHRLMRSCQAALATSGTVTMELALFGVPTCVVYNVSHLNAVLARVVFRINLPFYCIVNIVEAKEVFPELIYVNFTPKKAAEKMALLLGSGREACLAGCRAVQERLACMHPSTRGAQIIASMLSSSER